MLGGAGGLTRILQVLEDVGKDGLQVVGVGALADLVGEGGELVAGDVAEAEGDLLRAGDLQALAALDGLDEVCGVQQRVVGAGVEPGHAAAEKFGAELAAVEVPAVHVGDLELAARGGFERFGDGDDLRVVEVDAGDGVARLGLRGLFFERDGFAGGVKLDHAMGCAAA